MRQKKESGFWARARRFPPILVRLLAHDERGWPMSDDQIAARSGLSLFTVQIISQALDWSCCDVVTMQKYLVACNRDLEDRHQRHRAYQFLERPTWQRLRRSPQWKSLYEPLLIRYRDSIVAKIKVTNPKA